MPCSSSPTGVTNLLIDPFLTGNPTAAVAADAVAPTAILVTHGHVDHLGDYVDISKRTGARRPDFVIRLNGKTVHVAGDTALFGDRDLIGDENLDVAIIPIGGQYTMDATDASRPSPSCVRRFVIAGHYNTFPTIGSDPVAFAEAVAASTKARAVVLEPGQSAEV